MSRFEHKIVSLLLKRVRGLHLNASARQTACEQQPDLIPRAAVRVAELSDFEQVCTLNLRLGQGPDSTENWQRLWRDNPMLPKGQRNAPLGWVLEAGGSVVGFLGSIPLRYEFRGSTLKAAATCRFAVEPAYRPFSHLLMMSFLRQSDVDLFLNTTATPAAAKIMTALKASPMPQGDYGRVLFWVLNPRGFAEAALERVGAHAPLRLVGSTLLSGALKVDRSIRHRAPRARALGLKIRTLSVQDIGPEFDRLWSSYSQESGGLWAARSREIMRWHFDPPGSRRMVTVHACYRDSELLGYVIVRHDGNHLGSLRRSLIADLIARHDDPELIEELFAAAWEGALAANCHVLEVIGFPERIRAFVQRWKPYERQYPAHPFYFKVQNRQLNQALLDEGVWYASPFDGDSTLWP